MTKLDKLKARLLEVQKEQEWLERNPFTIGAQKRGVALCKAHSRLENQIADEEYENGQ